MSRNVRRELSSPFMPPGVDQLELFAAHADGLDEAFKTYLAENPRVYAMVVQFSKEAKAAGRKRFGMKMVWERLRWYSDIETRDRTGLKLNNVYTSRMGRAVMLNERCSPFCEWCEKPDCLAGIFEVRELKTPHDPNVLRIAS